jgi:hypothetical protein
MYVLNTPDRGWFPMHPLADILQEDPAAILDIKEDIREECSKLGEVTNVVLYDKEQAGVVSVRFSDPEAARNCVKVNPFPKRLGFVNRF